jgi:hypothetical protein
MGKPAIIPYVASAAGFNAFANEGMGDTCPKGEETTSISFKSVCHVTADMLAYDEPNYPKDCPNPFVKNRGPIYE